MIWGAKNEVEVSDLSTGRRPICLLADAPCKRVMRTWKCACAELEGQRSDVESHGSGAAHQSDMRSYMWPRRLHDGESSWDAYA